MHRRRLAALGALALLGLGAGLAVGISSGAPGKQPAEQAAEQVTAEPLDRLVGNVVIARFDGPRLPRRLRAALRQGHVAGVILFRDNVRSAGQVRRLTRQVQRAARGQALVCTDQEGGAIRILPFAGSPVGEASQDTPAEAAAAARSTAAGLRAVGVNVNLAPVADVPSGPGAFIRDRAFKGSPEAVAAKVGAAVSAYREAGVAATAKHFPGLGRASVNTDEGSSVVHASKEQLAADLAPFHAAVKAGVPLVMASHASYSAFGRAIASQSRALLTGLLKGELGFRGAVMTDSLEAQAVLDRSSIETAALRSIRAGADLVLTTGSGSYPRVYRALLREARRSPAFRERLRHAAARVAGVRAAAGLGRG